MNTADERLYFIPFAIKKQGILQTESSVRKIPAVHD